MNPIATIPVFHVSDVDASLRFYTEVLGFSLAFRYGTYVGLKLGDCEIHICPPDEQDSRVGSGNAYVICNEVDEYFRKIRIAGAKVAREPEDRAYGLRDFVVRDPDGNQLSFGCDNERA